MKTTKFWIMLLVTLLCTGFAACGDDDDDEIITGNLLGVWKVQYTIWDNGESESDSEEYWEFRSDGKLVTYYLDTYNQQWNTYEDPYTFDKTRNKLTIVDRKDGAVTVDVKFSKDKNEIDIITPEIWGWSSHLVRYNSSLPTINNEDNQPSSTIDGFKFVDMGLSVKWAASNLSGYYQYGNPTANDFKTEYGLTKYSIGGTSEDPAYANMSSKWRLPTRGEAQELVNDCTWEYTGNSFKVTGPNGNSILLPLDGAYPLGNESSLLYYGYQCWLMTSTLDGGGNPRPYILKASYINSYTPPSVTVTTNEAYRISGMSVRGVSKAEPDVTYNQ